MFFVYFVGPMAFDRLEHKSPRPIEEKVESHTPAPTPSREQNSRAESSMGTASRAQ